MKRSKCRKCLNGHADGFYCLMYDQAEKNEKVRCAAFIRLNNYHVVTRKNLENLAQMFADGCPPGVEKECSGNDREQCKRCWVNWFKKPAKLKAVNDMVKEEFGEE